MISLMGIVAIGQDLIGWWICLLFLPAVIFWEIIKDYFRKFLFQLPFKTLPSGKVKVPCP